jgi:hypothetical protein
LDECFAVLLFLFAKLGVLRTSVGIALHDWQTQLSASIAHAMKALHHFGVARFNLRDRQMLFTTQVDVPFEM